MNHTEQHLADKMIWSPAEPIGILGFLVVFGLVIQIAFLVSTKIRDNHSVKKKQKSALLVKDLPDAPPPNRPAKKLLTYSFSNDSGEDSFGTFVIDSSELIHLSDQHDPEPHVNPYRRSLRNWVTRHTDDGRFELSELEDKYKWQARNWLEKLYFGNHLKIVCSACNQSYSFEDTSVEKHSTIDHLGLDITICFESCPRGHHLRHYSC